MRGETSWGRHNTTRIDVGSNSRNEAQVLSASTAPHQETTEDTTMQIALLRQANERVLQGCVAEEDGIS